MLMGLRIREARLVMLRTSGHKHGNGEESPALGEAPNPIPDSPAATLQAGLGVGDSMQLSSRLSDGPSFRWVICGLLFLATSINYMDRQVMAILAPLLQGKLGWNEQEYAHLVFVFQLAYLIGLLGVGWFIDRCGLKIGYIIAIAVWSLAACATALSTTLLGFAMARFALGLGEAGNFPAATKTVGEWFPRRERSLATGLFNTGTSSGAIVAPLLVPWIARTWGWEMAFVFLGASGFVWIVFWLTFYQRPEKSRYISKADVLFIRTDDAPEIAFSATEENVGRVHWLELFRFPQTWGIVVSSALVVPVMWFQVFWLPKFLGSRFGVSISQAGLPLAVAFSMQLIGSILGGVLATRLILNGKSVHFARKFSLGLCAFCVMPIAFVGLIPFMWGAILVVGFAMAAMQGWSANSYSITTDLYPKRAIASMVGLGTAAGSIGSMVFAEFAGWYLQRTGGHYSLLFVLAGCGFPCAFLAVHLFIPHWQVVVMESQVVHQDRGSHGR